MRTTGIRLLAIGLLSGALLACSAEPEPEVVPVDEAAPAAPASPAVSDAEIAAIVVAANEIDAELGDVAAERGTEADVKSFGEAMARDHRMVNEQAVALVTRLGVTPVESDVSRQLRSDAQAFRTQLDAKSGAEFDSDYIAHEVAYHQAVIDALDDLLIPNATNAELRQLLVSVRPSLVAHRQMAVDLQARLQ